MANPTSNFGWQMPQNTDLVKDLPADFEVFGQAVDTSLMDLKGGTTGQVLSKASNTDMDFTWTNVDPLTILDAKGDLITATAADTPARLASSGNNGDLLTVDTSTATGLKWAAPASSGGITLISETVASGLSSLSLSSIPGTYKDLLLVWHGLYTSSTGLFQLRLNNDSASNYSSHSYTFESTGIIYTDNRTVVNGVLFGGFFVGNQTSDTNYQNQWQGSLRIYNYASTTRFKKYDYESGGFRAGVGERGSITSGTYKSTSAITSIDTALIDGSGTFSNATSTSIRLYGIS